MAHSIVINGFEFPVRESEVDLAEQIVRAAQSDLITAEQAQEMWSRMSGQSQHETAAQHGSGEFELEHIVLHTIADRADVAFLSEHPREHFAQFMACMERQPSVPCFYVPDSNRGIIRFSSPGVEWRTRFLNSEDGLRGQRFDRIFRILD